MDATVEFKVSRIGPNASLLLMVNQSDRSVTPLNRSGHRDRRNEKCLKVNGIPKLGTVPYTPRVKTVSSPFKGIYYAFMGYKIMFLQ